MKITVSVEDCDKQINFLENEIRQLRNRSEAWAGTKVENLERVKETVRQVRQAQQMKGVKDPSGGSGKTNDGPVEVLSGCVVRSEIQKDKHR